MTAQFDIAAVNARLSERMADLARQLVCSEPTAVARDEMRFRGHGSLRVWIGGPKRGQWFDFEAGVGGDPLWLVVHLRTCSWREAWDWAVRWLGWTPESLMAPPRAGSATRSPSPKVPPKRTTVDLARRLWRESLPATGTFVEIYLASRRLRLPDDAPLRFHAQASRNRACGPAGPAMLALMTHPIEYCGSADSAGLALPAEYSAFDRPRPVGVHVTYLRPDGRGKAEGKRPKIMLGGAGVVRLVPDAEVTMGLGLAEGIETALSVMQAHDWRPVWAAGSAGGIGTFPILSGVEALTIFVDADDGGVGLAAGRRCAARWRDAGREARIVIPRPGEDFNDDLRRGAA